MLAASTRFSVKTPLYIVRRTLPTEDRDRDRISGRVRVINVALEYSFVGAKSVRIASVGIVRCTPLGIKIQNKDCSTSTKT